MHSAHLFTEQLHSATAAGVLHLDREDGALLHPMGSLDLVGPGMCSDSEGRHDRASDLTSS